MRIYRNSVYVTGCITLISAFMSFVFHYWFLKSQHSEIEFWCNVALAIFGSGLLTFISSTVGYCAERQKTLEGLRYQTERILHFLNKYEISWNRKKKLEFYISYMDQDFSTWDAYMGDIVFLHDQKHKYEYIYNIIYKPILDLNNAIGNKLPNFKWHLEGTGRNDGAMDIFISEIEGLFLKVEESKIRNVNGKAVTYSMVSKPLVHNILTELRDGYYYEIMYPRKQ